MRQIQIKFVRIFHIHPLSLRAPCSSLSNTTEWYFQTCDAIIGPWCNGSHEKMYPHVGYIKGGDKVKSQNAKKELQRNVIREVCPYQS